MCVCVAKPVAVELRCHATALIAFLFQFCPDYISQHPFQVNIMKELSAGGHLYEPVLGNDIVSMQFVLNAEKTMYSPELKAEKLSIL